jgi:hypothetical protein
LNIFAHRAILTAALGGEVKGRSLGLIILANLGCDLRQFSPEWHFDSAQNPEALLALWKQGGRRALVQTVMTYCRPRHGRPQHPYLACLALGAASHATADFYAHTNWIELYLEECSAGAIPLAPLYDLDSTVDQFPRGLQSGYFHLRYGIHGCRRKGGVYYPPPGFAYAHAQLAKDFPHKGHGADLVSPGVEAVTYFDIAMRLATDGTRRMWQSLSDLLQAEYGPVGQDLLVFPRE